MTSGSPEHALAGAVRLCSQCFMGPAAQFCRPERGLRSRCLRAARWRAAGPSLIRNSDAALDAVCARLQRAPGVHTAGCCRCVMCAPSVPRVYLLSRAAYPTTPMSCIGCLPARVASALLVPCCAARAPLWPAVLRQRRRFYESRAVVALCPNKLLTSCMAATSVHMRVSWVMQHGACAVWALCRCLSRWWGVFREGVLVVAGGQGWCQGFWVDTWFLSWRREVRVDRPEEWGGGLVGLHSLCHRHGV